MAKTLKEVLDGLRAWGAGWKTRALTPPEPVIDPTEVPFDVPLELGPTP